MLEHKHLIVRAQIARPPTDPLEVEAWIVSVIQGIGMKLAVGLQSNPISYRCNLEGNEGITAVGILETSHCAVHIWDDVSPAMMQLDIYTCSELDPSDIFGFLEVFQPVDKKWHFIDRKDDITILGNGV